MVLLYLGTITHDCSGVESPPRDFYGGESMTSLYRTSVPALT
jgi:hypothetical protein